MCLILEKSGENWTKAQQYCRENYEVFSLIAWMLGRYLFVIVVKLKPWSQTLSPKTPWAKLGLTL